MSETEQCAGSEPETNNLDSDSSDTEDLHHKITTSKIHTTPSTDNLIDHQSEPIATTSSNTPNSNNVEKHNISKLAQKASASVISAPSIQHQPLQQQPIHQQPANIPLENMANRFDIVNKRINANIPRFEGGPYVEEHLVTFLKNCDFVLDSLDGDAIDIGHFMVGLRNRFEKDAYQLIINSNVVTYEALKKLLRETYKPEKTLAEINHAFFNCKQSPDEQMTTFFRRLHTLLNESKRLLTAKFPHNNEGLIQNQEEEAINVFKRGITNKGLKQHLLMSPAATLADLEIEAKAYENAEKQHYNVPKW